VDLPDKSAFKDNDIVPRGAITVHIWWQYGWGGLWQLLQKERVCKLIPLPLWVVGHCVWES